MKVDISDAPRSQKELSIELPYEEYEKGMGAEADALAKMVKIPGFRPGKVPVNVVRKQHLNKIKADALEKLFSHNIKDALITNNINPLNPPDVRDIKVEEGEPITFKAYVDVFPNVTVANVGGHEFNKMVITIDKSDIGSTIEQLRERLADYVVPDKARAAKTDDLVLIDYVGKIDGKKFDGGTADKQSLLLGSKSFIAGFEEGIEGMKVDGTKTITIDFPEDYHQKDLAGKKASFDVTLHEIKEKKLPEANDDFAKKVSGLTSNLNELKTKIKEDLQDEADHLAQLENMLGMLDVLIEENPFEVPDSVVREQAERIAQQNLAQYYKMGLDPATYGFDVKTMAEKLMIDAETQIKRALVINRIAETAKLEVVEADIAKEFERISERAKRSVEEIKKEITDNAQLFSTMKSDLLSDKVYAYLVSNNTMKETLYTKSEFEQMKAERDALEAQASAEKVQADNKGQE
ncbi:trigger factor [Deferribacterales bacterium RsTz2092]|nr:trigger factor [Deferribacterales bacterium]